jgi:hypothetical protein
LVAELIMLDGQILNGSDHLGDWKTSSFDGWWDSPDAKSQDVERDQADGDHDLDVFYQSRYVTIPGRLAASSHETLHLGMNRFTGLVQKRARLQVSGHGPTVWADVKRASGISIVPVTDKFAQWQLRLKAPDSRKFGDFESFAIAAGTPVGVHHRGNYDASPLFRVHGPTVAYTITGPDGEEYTVTGGLGGGNEHVIDFNDGLLRVNGVITAAVVPKAELWKVPAGQKVTATLSAGNAHIELLDTYI